MNGMVHDVLFVVYTERKEIVFDRDCPELTPAMEKAFRLAAKNRNTQRKINIS